MGVEQPDPEIPLDRVQLAQQRRQRIARVDESTGLRGFGRCPSQRSMPKYVVSCEIRLISFTPACHQRSASRTTDSCVRRAMLAADLGDDAKGTGMIAAFGDLDVGDVRRRQPEARSVIIRNVSRRPRDQVVAAGILVVPHQILDHRRHRRDLIQSDKRVHLRHQRRGVPSENAATNSRPR